MFTNWGTWLGIANENGKGKQEGECAIAVNEDNTEETNKQATEAEGAQTSSAVKKDAESTQLIQKAKGFSGKCDKVDQLKL